MSTENSNNSNNIGTRLRDFRLQQGWSQQHAADLLRMNRSYLSEVENGVVPKSLLLERIEILLGDRPQTNTSNNRPLLSQRMGSLIQEAGAALFSSARMIPVISFVQAGSMSSYEELPSDWAEEIATDCPNRKAFGLEIRGDSMLPHYPEGFIVTVMPEEEPRNGKLVVARMKNDDAAFKIYHRTEGKDPIIQLTSYNSGAFPKMEFHPREFFWIWPVYEARRNLWR